MRALDLFCGACGGWSLGLHRAGIETIAACEINPWRRGAYLTNFPGVRMYEDVRLLTADRLAADGAVPDIIVGSPPCQDASTANPKGRGVDGERTGLFFEFVRLVREVRPLWCVAENVPGLRVRGADRVLAELEAAGYAAWPLVVGADDLRAPHRRKRVWIIARARSAESVRRRAAGGRLEWQEAASRNWASPDAAGAGLAVGKGIGPDTRAQLSAIERAVGEEGYLWNGSPLGHIGLADGLSPGLARASASAYGDAILPQIACAIAQTIMTMDAG